MHEVIGNTLVYDIVIGMFYTQGLHNIVMCTFRLPYVHTVHDWHVYTHSGGRILRYYTVYETSVVLKWHTNELVQRPGGKLLSRLMSYFGIQTKSNLKTNHGGRTPSIPLVISFVEFTVRALWDTGSQLNGSSRALQSRPWTWHGNYPLTALLAMQAWHGIMYGTSDMIVKPHLYLDL